MFGRVPITHVYKLCKCGVQVKLQQRGGYKRCSCGRAHTTTINGTHVVDEPLGKAVNEPLPLPPHIPAWTEDEIDHFMDLIHNDLLLPMDF